jgi:succinate dehydrogenase / fumarate reductase, membrane anchor subunit
MSDFKTPLKKARGLGSAKSGTEHFWQQRLTAIANVPLVMFLIWFIISHLSATRPEIVVALKNPFVSMGILLALISITWHMRLGLQVVIEDYVHSEGRKLLALTLNTFFVLALTAIGAFSILKMGFGL